MTGQRFVCLSTHGASGYAPGTHWIAKPNFARCGVCHEVIVDPRPTQYQFVFYTFREALSSWAAFKKWFHSIPKEIVPLWPF